MDLDKINKKLAEKFERQLLKDSFSIFSQSVETPKCIFRGNGLVFNSDVLVCKDCGHAVSQGIFDYYECHTCKCLTQYVEWQKQDLIA